MAVGISVSRKTKSNILSRFHVLHPATAVPIASDDVAGEEEGGKMAPKREGDPPPEIVDYRWAGNDAWYGAVARSEEEGRVLRVMYLNFSGEWDERFRADQFGSEAELEEFEGRFRRGSVQLQDADCGAVDQGMTVNVSHAFGVQDVRFYDALVDSVHANTHPPTECSCTFVVRWQHGPLVGKITSTGIENICLLQQKNIKMDPTVRKFLDIARQKLEERESQGAQTAGNLQENSMHVVDNSKERPSNSSGYLGHDADKVYGASCSSRSNASPNDSRLSNHCYVPSRLEDEETSEKLYDSRHTPKEGKSSNSMLVEDTELGSDLREKMAGTKKRRYFFRIENVEKNLSAFDVMDFVFEKTSLTCNAFICPSILEEFYSRATILVETEEEANKLFEFLLDSSRIIVSSRGRPWLTNENWCGYMDDSLARYEVPSRNRSDGHRSKLKLVYEGTEEYEQAHLLLAHHIKFHEHVHNNLLRRLMEDEKSLRQQPKSGKKADAATDSSYL